MQDQVKKMDPAKKARIVATLRSGDYQQAQSALAKGPEDSPNAFCALGVICEEFRKDYPDEFVWACINTYDEFDLVPREEYEKLRAGRGCMDEDEYETALCALALGGGMLPREVAQWLGLPDNPTYRVLPLLVIEQDKVMLETVPGLNDSGVSLSKIADLIDKNL